MAEVKISVVVPVHNAAAFLSETLDSLACQSFRDFEVILVDDGSTDESPRILDGVCTRDARFRALHIPNGGVYRARLTGIREAAGEYVAFCDSDDLYRPEFLEKLYRQAESTGADVTVCGFTREDMETGQIRSREMTALGDRVYSYPALLDVLPRVNGSIWNKLYRAELLRNVIELERPPRIAEDVMFLCSLYPCLRRIAFLPELLYRYRVRPDSMVSRMTAEDRELMRESLLRTRELVLARDGSPEMRYVMDCVAFLHVGLGQVLFMAGSGEKYRVASASARRWLERYAPGYRRAGHDLRWNLAHENVQLRILIQRWLFRARLTRPATFAFELLTRVLGGKGKW